MVDHDQELGNSSVSAVLIGTPDGLTFVQNCLVLRVSLIAFVLTARPARICVASSTEPKSAAGQNCDNGLTGGL